MIWLKWQWIWMKETSACLIRWLTIRPRIANRLKKQFGNSGGLNLETRDSETFEVRSGEKKKVRFRISQQRKWFYRKKENFRKIKKSVGPTHKKTSNQIAEEQRNKQMSYLCFFSFDALSQSLPMILTIEWKPIFLIDSHG